MNLNAFLKDAKTVTVAGTQWGDEAKGKFVDLFAGWAKIIIRGTGGANAGHTIIVGGTEHIFHLIPSGILYDALGKINVIGSGVALDPQVVLQELALLRKAGMSYNHMAISDRAKLVMPQHILIDRIRETKQGKIGTTRRGIGPTYVDHYDRIGITLNDLRNPDVLADKLKLNLEPKVRYLRSFNSYGLQDIMLEAHLGAFYKSGKIFDQDAIIAQYRQYGVELKDLIRDTDQIVAEHVGRDRILLEGAQGFLLGIDSGTYPHVTSSDTSVAGLARGAGLDPRMVDLAFGVTKAPFMSRVGDGAFPTEMGRRESEELCGAEGYNREVELQKGGVLSVNDPDPLRQGIAIRQAGGEYGSTTGRARRMGWLDLVLLRQAIRHNGPNLILTKLDVLDECKEIKICNDYRYIGPNYHLGDQELQFGQLLHNVAPDSYVLRHVEPVYYEFPGWQCCLRDLKESSRLPSPLRNIIIFIGQQAGARIRAISVGPDREQTIIL